MDYAKYSHETFASLAPGSPELSLLVGSLREEVNSALHEAVHAKLSEIVSSLNREGHSFAESLRSKPGAIDFTQIDENEKHVFYLCCDTVISSGYQSTTAHTE